MFQGWVVESLIKLTQVLAEILIWGIGLLILFAIQFWVAVISNYIKREKWNTFLNKKKYYFSKI